MSALAKLTSRGLGRFSGRPRHLAQGQGLGLMLRAGVMALAAAGLVATVLEGAADLLASRQPAVRSLAVTASPEAWFEINRPIALYDLTGTDFSRLPLTSRARRRQPDGAREDLLTFGSLRGDKPFLRLSLLRLGSKPPPAGAVDDGQDPLTDGLARLASAGGLTASRIRAAVPVETRLGRIETADLLLWADGNAKACLGFRAVPQDGQVLRIAGLACGTPTRPVGRAALACAIDRIDLVSAGDDAALRAVFVAAERRDGSTCLEEAPTRLAGALMTSGRRLGWLDPDGDLPPLRGLFGGSRR